MDFFGINHFLGLDIFWDHVLLNWTFSCRDQAFMKCYLCTKALCRLQVCAFSLVCPPNNPTIILYHHSIPENHSFPVWTYISGYHPRGEWVMWPPNASAPLGFCQCPQFMRHHPFKKYLWWWILWSRLETMGSCTFIPYIPMAHRFC